jgi:hypothetical protein
VSAWRAVVLHELRLRASMPVVALALGIVSTIVTRRVLVPTDAPFAVLAVSMGVTLIVALLTGASALGGYLGTGRLSFYFVRPVSWWAIWSGRLAACALLTGGCAVISLLPWIVLRPTGPNDPGLGDSAPWAAFVATALLAIAVAGGSAAARHAHLATRLVHIGLLGATAALVFAYQDSLRYGTWAAVGRNGEALLLWPIALAVLTATAVQARAGRADARRGHWTTAAVAWGLVALTLGACALAGEIVTRATPAALTRFDWASREGDWIAVGGPVFGTRYPAAFLVEPRSGRFVRIGAGDRVGSFTVAPRGGSGFVQRGDPFDPRGGDGSVGGRTRGWKGLVVEGLSGTSPGISQILDLETKSRHVYVTDSGCVFLWGDRVRWRCRGQDWMHPRMWSDDYEVEAVAQMGDGTVRALFDLRCVYIVRLTERPSIPRRPDQLCIAVDRYGRYPSGVESLCEDFTGTFDSFAASLSFDSSGSRLLALDGETRDGVGGVSLLDGRTGRVVSTLARGRVESRSALFTPGGQVALASIEGGRGHARLFTRDGSPVDELDLGGVDRIEWIGRVGDAHAFAWIARGDKTSLMHVEWQSGSIEEEAGLEALPKTPVPPPPPWKRPARRDIHFLRDSSGNLVELDPDTGERRIVLRPR